MARDAVAARKLISVVADVLDSNGLRGALIGGQGVNCWVELRITFDIDIEVVAVGRTVRDVVEQFLESGFRIVIRQDPGGESGPDFVRLNHIELDVDLDIQVSKTEFEDGVIARAVQQPGQRIPVATPEDLIVMKLLASRSKDMKDLYDLGKREGLDWDYITHWCREWQVTDRLASLHESLEHDRRIVRELYEPR